MRDLQAQPESNMLGSVTGSPSAMMSRWAAILRVFFSATDKASNSSASNGASRLSLAANEAARAVEESAVPTGEKRILHPKVQSQLHAELAAIAWRKAMAIVQSKPPG